MLRSMGGGCSKADRRSNGSAPSECWGLRAIDAKRARRRLLYQLIDCPCFVELRWSADGRQAAATMNNDHQRFCVRILINRECQWVAKNLSWEIRSSPNQLGDTRTRPAYRRMSDGARMRTFFGRLHRYGKPQAAPARVDENRHSEPRDSAGRRVRPHQIRKHSNE